MSVSPSRPPDDLVPRLRSAGCVFAEDEAALLVAAAREHLDALVERRLSGEPLEHVLGWAPFWGLRIAVDPGVFVPRRRTELLVQQALLGSPHVVVDLCCGSGAVGAALESALPDVELHACDLDPRAVACARRNLRGQVHVGDLLAALPDSLRGRVDVLVANAPYVPSGQIRLLPTEARDHEPIASLDGGPDGLDLVRRIASDATGWLAPGGRLIVESSDRQLSAAVAAVAAFGLDARPVRCDVLDAAAVVATWD